MIEVKEFFRSSRGPLKLRRLNKIQLDLEKVSAQVQDGFKCRSEIAVPNPVPEPRVLLGRNMVCRQTLQ